MLLIEVNNSGLLTMIVAPQQCYVSAAVRSLTTGVHHGCICTDESVNSEAYQKIWNHLSGSGNNEDANYVSASSRCT